MLDQQGTLFDRFRMFTMSDAAERGDHLLGAFYPRSLLHLVSGLLERDTLGASRCVPFTGLARYLYPAQATPAELVSLRRQLNTVEAVYRLNVT